MATERFLTLGGSHNFRHMGGYPAAGGRTTRGDRLYRSGWFALEGDDVARFSALGITQLFDLRTAAERDKQPLVLPDGGPEQISLPMASGSMGAYLDTVSRLEPDEIDCKSAMVRMYGEMPEQGMAAFASLFEQLAEGEGGALIICATGKDRTGVASALLLTALGVSREDVLADYMISADVYRGHEEEFARRHNYEARTGHALGLFRDVFTVHPEYLDAVGDGALDIVIDGLLRPGEPQRLADRFTQ
jgi:protein-tyrosine phosphatase